MHVEFDAAAELTDFCLLPSQRCLFMYVSEMLEPESWGSVRGI